MLDQDTPSDTDVEQDEVTLNLTWKIMIIQQANNIVPESLISKVIEEDSEESSEGIDDGNWFDDNNGDNAKFVSMYKNQE